MYKLIVVIIILGFAVNISQACDQDEQKEKSIVSYVHLYEKDPVTWDIVCNGSWGKLKFRSSGKEFDFVFYGYNLDSGVNYTLIYYPDPWPGEGLICLGHGKVNFEGKIYIAKSVDTGNLPSENDQNEGAKIWLVLSSDVDYENSKMIGWNPSKYLFEQNLIHYTKPIFKLSNKECVRETVIEVKKPYEADDQLEESISLNKWFKVLDNIIDRFPIIKKILQMIVELVIDNLSDFDYF